MRRGSIRIGSCAQRGYSYELRAAPAYILSNRYMDSEMGYRSSVDAVGEESNKNCDETHNTEYRGRDALQAEVVRRGEEICGRWEDADVCGQRPEGSIDDVQETPFRISEYRLRINLVVNRNDGGGYSSLTTQNNGDNYGVSVYMDTKSSQRRRYHETNNGSRSG